jgi:calcium-dependent protein kinase
MDQPVKLIDFGLAKEVDSQTIYTDKVGTPFYVSPETIDSHHPHYNVRNGDILKSGDMWAIGAIVFVLITGKLPFPGRKHKDIFRNITKCRFKFPETILLSDSVKDFIHCLLQVDPTKRFTCDQALAHPWIVHKDAAPADPLNEMVLSGLGQFQRQNKLQRAVARIAINHLTDKDISMLQDLFATYDKDRSGQIEIPELIQLLKDSGFDADAAEQEAMQLMEDLDSNKDGALTMVEFAQVAARPRVSISRTIVRRTFDSMDMDGDGKVNAFELKESLQIDDAYIEKIFRNIDTNQDGMLTFEEFLEAMKVTIKTRREKSKPQRKSVFELNFSADPNAPPHLAPLEKSPVSRPPKPVQEDEDNVQVTEDNLQN